MCQAANLAFPLQGVNRNWHQSNVFYFTASLISGGYLLVNSQKLIFYIGNPTLACHLVATLPPCRSATDIGYTSKKLSKMVGIQLAIQYTVDTMNYFD